MSAKKPPHRTDRPTKGTVVAAKYRTRLNPATDETRAALLERGMHLIYGPHGSAKTSVGRR